jgi:hypothetical protein
VKKYIILILFIQSLVALGQRITITGKITEASSGVAIPFANITLKDNAAGTTSDFDGNYRLSYEGKADSIIVTYIGFIRKSKPLSGQGNTINFQLDEDLVSLEGITFFAGENPAFEILRKVVDNKERNDKRNIPAYEFENYTKIEISVDNISDKFKNRKIVKKISSILDSIQVIAGEDGKPILPIFISEALSTVYQRSEPRMKLEQINKTKITGIGVTDGTLTSQVIGGSFQEYNFYMNWLNIVAKEFISPIADGWRIYYDYSLTDSLYIGEHFCYKLDFWPRREQDLAFSGTMWITKNEYALKQIDATVSKTANLNFIEKIKIQQELIPTSAGPWLPQKYRVVIDVSQVTDETAGLLAKFYVSLKDIKITEPRDTKFYDVAIEMAEDVRENDEDFWIANRHDSLTAVEINVFQMIDTLKRIPVVKTYTDLLKIAGTGYYPVGKFDLGHYGTFFGNNNIEGIRLGFGARTNYQFSKEWVFQYRFGYGFDDQKLKHQATVERIISRKPWTTLQYEYVNDINAIWALNGGFGSNTILYALSRFGTLQQPFMIQRHELKFQTQIRKGLIQKIEFKNQWHDPLFNFQYFTDPSKADSPIASNFTSTELAIETRFAKDELFVINDNQRLSLGTVRWPAINIRYTIGLKDAFGGDFSYHKLDARVFKSQKMGFFGVSNIELSGGYNFSQLPYPLLTNHIGNATNFFSSSVYNTMEFFEFTSDHHVGLAVSHHFEGFLLNSIPLMKKLKWRMVSASRILFGGVRPENLQTIPQQFDTEGNAIVAFKPLDFSRPYIEVGYGVENIFKVLRVDAFHRLSYLENTTAPKFSVKFSLQFVL